jgi:CheY-like chemotaxis protein
MTILVVEDDEDFRDVLQRICEETGHDAVCVGTQQEALAAVASRRFDLVLLDLGIPLRPGTSPRDWAGRVVLTTMRSAGDLTPVIVITAQGKGYQLCRDLLVDEKATDFVQKTLDGWQGPPLGDVIRRTLAASRETTASAPRPTAPERVYPSTVRLHFDGRPTSKGYLVAVDGEELKVRKSPFDLLVQLAVGLLRGSEHEYVDLRRVANYHKRIQRVRDDLAKRKGVDALVLVEGDGQGRYRLSTAPSRITADLASLKTYHDKLLQRLGGWPTPT